MFLILYLMGLTLSTSSSSSLTASLLGAGVKWSLRPCGAFTAAFFGDPIGNVKDLPREADAVGEASEDFFWKNPNMDFCPLELKLEVDFFNEGGCEDPLIIIQFTPSNKGVSLFDFVKAQKIGHGKNTKVLS